MYVCMYVLMYVPSRCMWYLVRTGCCLLVVCGCVRSSHKPQPLLLPVDIQHNNQTEGILPEGQCSFTPHNQRSICFRRASVAKELGRLKRKPPCVYVFHSLISRKLLSEYPHALAHQSNQDANIRNFQEWNACCGLSCVRTTANTRNGSMSRREGPWQGCVLSPFLFNVFSSLLLRYTSYTGTLHSQRRRSHRCM